MQARFYRRYSSSEYLGYHFRLNREGSANASGRIGSSGSRCSAMGIPTPRNFDGPRRVDGSGFLLQGNRRTVDDMSDMNEGSLVITYLSDPWGFAGADDMMT